jgi:ribose transport system substrate-binding protein
MIRHVAGAAFGLALSFVGLPGAGAAKTIAVFTKDQGTPVSVALREGANTAEKTLGVRVVHYVPSTPDNVAQQIKLIDDAIKDKSDAIVFVPINAAAVGGAVAKIGAAHIPLINLNERLAGGMVTGYVGIDDYALARETGRYLLKAMGGKGNVVILDGPADTPSAKDRARGFRDVLKEFPAVKLLAGKSAGYARALATQVTKDLLGSYPQIDGILAANDPMAIGAADALQAAGRKALVVGINASPEVMSLIKSGAVIGSGDYDAFAQGCLAVEMAVRAARKESIPHDVMLKPVVIDKTNAAPFDLPLEQRQCPTLSSVTAQ